MVMSTYPSSAVYLTPVHLLILQQTPMPVTDRSVAEHSSPTLLLPRRAIPHSPQLFSLDANCTPNSVADIIRSCLGPKAMLKMLLDPMGGIVLTNDGHAILREIEVSHPAAKSMIELSRTQDEEVGDGTTTVIILGNDISYLRSILDGC